MKALSSSAGFLAPGLCLITALASACSLDMSQLRPLADGAIEHPGVPDAPHATGGIGGARGGYLVRPSRTSLITRPSGNQHADRRAQI